MNEYRDPAVGDPVVLVAQLDALNAHILGAATFDGVAVPEHNASPVARALKMSHTKAPMYRLTETGESVWDFEAWAIPAAEAGLILGARRQIPVTVAQLRAAAGVPLAAG